MNPREAFSLLGDRARYEIVRELLENEGISTKERLAERVAATGSGISTEEALIALRHVHLPKLEASGVVTFTERGSPVVLTTRGRRLEPLVDAVAGGEEREREQPAAAD